MERAVPLVVAAPIVWVGLEYVRTHFPTGFPFLSHVGAFQLIGVQRQKPTGLDDSGNAATCIPGSRTKATGIIMRSKYQRLQ